MGFDGQILQEQSVYRSFQTNMQLVDLVFGAGEDADAEKSQLLEERRRCFLVPGKPIETFSDDHIEFVLACIGQQALVAGRSVVAPEIARSR